MINWLTDELINFIYLLLFYLIIQIIIIIDYYKFDKLTNWWMKLLIDLAAAALAAAADAAADAASGDVERVSALWEDEETGDGGPIREILESESIDSAPGLNGPDPPGDSRPLKSSDPAGLSGRFDDPDE